MSDSDVVRGLTGVARAWWAFLLFVGTAWLLFAVIVFRFDWRTVHAFAILFGIVLLAAAFDELLAAFAERGPGWMKFLHVVLAIAFVVLAVIAFVHPGDTFTALAAVLSFYFVLKGTFDVIVALAVRAERELWWTKLLIGVVEILIGFWAAGDFGRVSILLVVWVGALAVTRGLDAITTAFTTRDSG